MNGFEVHFVFVNVGLKVQKAGSIVSDYVFSSFG